MRWQGWPRRATPTVVAHRAPSTMLR